MIKKSTEQGLEERFTKPEGWLWGQFTNARGGVLRFGRLSLHKSPLAHIVYVEGLSEYAEKKYELARDFNKMACNFSVFDRYGQGKSDRYLADTHKQHSGGITHDVEDLIRYCKTQIPPGEPIVLLGHSTGGLITLLAMEKEPDLFKAAILTAPLLGFKNMLLHNRESFFANLPMPGLLEKSYVFGGSRWRPRHHPLSAMKAKDFSSDPVRNKISDYWGDRDPALRAGSPTFGWIREMCRGIMQIRTPGFLARITRPVLVFTAGNDGLIENKYTFDASAGLKDAAHHHYDKGKHELLMETDDIRDDLLTKTHDFLKNKL